MSYPTKSELEAYQSSKLFADLERMMNCTDVTPPASTQSQADPLRDTGLATPNGERPIAPVGGLNETSGSMEIAAHYARLT